MIGLIDTLPPAMLDALLAHGWYRMRQHVFTTEYIELVEGVSTPVYWARIKLENFTPNHRHKKLTRFCRRFNCTMQDAVVTPEIEDLYTAYRNHIDFDAGLTAASFLLDEREVNFFPARMWQLRDEGRLIAVGYFDEGNISTAGILNFYDPAYKKYSPSLWLYFEGVRRAAELGKEYFYPGYIATGYTKFDYKLLAGIERMELWDPQTTQWHPYAGSVHEQYGKTVIDK